jgi:putative phosphoesterase
MRIGLVSDTHGLLRPQAVAALRGSDRILHAGDIGRAEILHALADIAPLTAVRGNNDQGEWASAVAHTERIEVDGVAIFLIHDLAELTLHREAAGCAVVVCGHSHRPLSQRRDGVLFINPGSAGPRRFKLPVSVGLLHLSDGQARSELVELSV